MTVLVDTRLRIDHRVRLLLSASFIFLVWQARATLRAHLRTHDEGVRESLSMALSFHRFDDEFLADRRRRRARARISRDIVIAAARRAQQ